MKLEEQSAQGRGLDNLQITMDERLKKITFYLFVVVGNITTELP